MLASRSAPQQTGQHTELVEALVDGPVLLVILLQREETNEGRQNVRNRDAVRMSHDHAAQAASSIVLDAGAVNLEHGLKLAKDGFVVRQIRGAVGRVEDELSGSIRSIALRFLVWVREALQQQGKQLASVGADSSLHVGGALSDDTNTGGALNVLRLGRGKLEDGRLKQLPELSKRATQGDSKPNDDVEGRVNDKPVVLGGPLNLLLFVFVAEILLARVRTRDDGGGDRDDLVHQLLVSQEGGATRLESGSDIAVDVSNNRPAILLAWGQNEAVVQELIVKATFQK